MNNKTDILAFFDIDRAESGNSPITNSIVKEWSFDRKLCRIVYTSQINDNLAEIIEREKTSAQRDSYQLEWKTYAHDPLTELPEKLRAAGFTAEDVEEVLYLTLNPSTIAEFPLQNYVIKTVQDERGLADYAEISRDIGRKNLTEEYESLLYILHNNPDSMQIHIAYHQEEPVSAGRLYLRPDGRFAELAGGRTKVQHRGQGFFTAVVGNRLLAAVEMNRPYAIVDALPTSAPILSKRGFRRLTQTQPFIFP